MHGLVCGKRTSMQHYGDEFKRAGSRIHLHLQRNLLYVIILDLAPCYSNPCEHGGHCVPIDGGKSFHCYCGAYWTGDRCQCKYIAWEN